MSDSLDIHLDQKSEIWISKVINLKARIIAKTVKEL